MHVRDLDSLDRASGGAERERGPWVVGVEVNLERGLVADDEQRVAEPLELRLEPVAIECLSLDHEDGAVAVARGLEVDRVHAGRCLGDGRGRQRLAGDRAGHAAQELDEPGSARVHDPRFPQDVELLGRSGHGLLPVPHELDEQVAERLGVGRTPFGLLCELADDREHRPLDRPPHCPVGGVGGSAQCQGGQRGIDSVRRGGEHVGDASHHLGEDDARVAARPHQRRPRDCVR